MPSLKFSKTAIDKLPFSTIGQVEYWDTESKGLGLRVGTESKTFFVKVDVRDTTKPRGYRTAKKTLGRYGNLTLDQAKKMVEGDIDKDGNAVLSERLQLKMAKPEDLPSKGQHVTLKELIATYYRRDKCCNAGS